MESPESGVRAVYVRGFVWFGKSWSGVSSVGRCVRSAAHGKWSGAGIRSYILVDPFISWAVDLGMAGIFLVTKGFPTWPNNACAPAKHGAMPAAWGAGAKRMDIRQEHGAHKRMYWISLD